MRLGNVGLRLIKYIQNPIIIADRDNAWESQQTFNPGAVILNDKVHLLYRAIGEDGISRLGYASSDNGFSISERSAYPAYQHAINQRLSYTYFYGSGGSFGGAEDPRLVRVDEENVLYMTYTACDAGLRVALTSIKIDDFLKKNWKWKKPVLISAAGETHKNWSIFPEKINGMYAILHSIKPVIQIEYVDTLEFDDNQHIHSIHEGGPQENGWDKWLRGAAAPPIKTEEGWLLLYHAMDDDWGKYKVGAMLLDLEDPTKILFRASEPILEPSEYYETNGFKGGVVYVTGAVIKESTLLIYYGAADSFVAVASAGLKDFLNALKAGKKTELLADSSDYKR